MIVRATSSTLFCLWTAITSVHCLSRGASLINKLSIIHVNDVHSHIDEFNKFGTDCRPSVITPHPQSQECGGGYARIKHEIDRLQEEHPNNLLLNAGDEFQGTMFYTYYKGEKSAEILNTVKFDAVTLGNHEFDDGPDHLALYLKNLSMPIVCANINTTISELSGQLIPYTIIEKYGVGIIGMITPETGSVSSPGDDVHFIEPIALMQGLIEELHKKGIKRIIALTHIGYHEDQHLVQSTRGLSMIVGAHSHTFLGEVPWSQGPYPTIAQDLDGIDVPIVTSGKWGFNLGHLQVEFDENGRINAYSGQPIQLVESIEQDSTMNEQILAWKQPFLDFASEVVGFARGSFAQMTCQITECSVGNLVAEAMLLAHPRAQIAMTNSGGLRAGISRGNITRGQVLSVLPFGSALVDIPFMGKELRAVVEGIMSWQNVETGHEITSFVQIAGMRVVYNGAKAKGSRIISITVREGANGTFIDLAEDKEYLVVTQDFLAGGGDFWWPEKKHFTQTEKVDDVLIAYLKDRKSVKPFLDGRIKDVSHKGRIKANAENFLAYGQKFLQLTSICFGGYGNVGIKMAEWTTVRLVKHFSS